MAEIILGLNCSRYRDHSITLDSNKHFHVTCAIIERDGLVLAAQRSESMSMPLKWEFPGGKVDAGETLEECLCRELAEELDINVQISRPLSPSTYRYPSFTITLYPFVCSLELGQPTLHEHADLIWMRPDELRTLDWAEADIPIVDAYFEHLSKIA